MYVLCLSKSFGGTRSTAEEHGGELRSATPPRSLVSLARAVYKMLPFLDGASASCMGL